MDAPSILSDREIGFLAELRARGVDFMIVGLSAAALQGAPVVTQDVDLWFRNLADPRIADALRAVGGVYVPPSMQNPPMFAGGGLHLFDVVTHMHGLGSYGEESTRTITVRFGEIDAPVLRLERIIASKKAANREKDRLVLPVLEDALAASQGE